MASAKRNLPSANLVDSLESKDKRAVAQALIPGDNALVD